MWKRKELKTKARKVVKKNYWTAIVVCFLIALLTGEFGTSILGVLDSEDSMDPFYIITHPNAIINSDNNQEKSELLKTQEEIVQKIETKKYSLDDIQLKILNLIEFNLDSITKSQKYVFKISDAIKSFILEKDELGIGLISIAILSIVFSIFIANPLTVAGKRYFLKARKRSNTKINVILEIFKNKNWLNVSIIIFLKDIYNMLWYLTIVLGVIKTYEYRMIPYILADNPKIGRKEAFKLSKQMMKGNKWKTFILDLSFIGWELLSIFTFGLLNILYVNPYKLATDVELYTSLKKEGIKNKFEYYEEFKNIDSK